MILTLGGTTQEDADSALFGKAYLDATWQEINNALKLGKKVVVIPNPYIVETLAGTTDVPEVTEVTNTLGGNNPKLYIAWLNTVKMLSADSASERPYFNFMVG